MLSHCRVRLYTNWHVKCVSTQSTTCMHYSDVIMGTMASLITSLTSVYSTVHPGADQRNVTGLCTGNSPATGEFPAQMANSGENVSISWRHHGNTSISRYKRWRGHAILVDRCINSVVEGHTRGRKLHVLIWNNANNLFWRVYCLYTLWRCAE